MQNLQKDKDLKKEFIIGQLRILCRLKRMKESQQQMMDIACIETIINDTTPWDLQYAKDKVFLDSFYKGRHHNWNYNEIITAKLDCNQWSVTY